VEQPMTIKLYAFTCGALTGEFGRLMATGRWPRNIWLAVSSAAWWGWRWPPALHRARRPWNRVFASLVFTVAGYMLYRNAAVLGLWSPNRSAGSARSGKAPSPARPTPDTNEMANDTEFGPADLFLRPASSASPRPSNTASSAQQGHHLDRDRPAPRHAHSCEISPDLRGNDSPGRGGAYLARL